VHPGPDITVPAAASLAGVPPTQARQDLGELARAHLIGEHLPGRYAFHNLLRAYAAGQAAAQDEQAWLAAAGRVADHYLHTAGAAVALTARSYDPVAIGPARPGVTPEYLEGYQQALAWFEAERQVLVAVITLASGTGFDTHAWQIPWAMSDFLTMRGHWHQWAAIQRIAVAAATRAGDTAGQAQALRLLAWVCAWLGDHDEALAHGTASLRLCQQTGDRAGEANAHHFLAGRQLLSVAAPGDSHGGWADALGHAEQALRLYQAVGYRSAEISALAMVAGSHILLGNCQQARACCQRALIVSADAGHLHDEANIWQALGYAECCLGNLAEAAACCQVALRLAREFGDLHGEAVALISLGDTRHASGELRQARDAWQQALDILDDLHLSAADEVRVKLASHNDRSHPEPPVAASGKR
jgi:tetratricopeptide (TPR) repeat protein